MLLLLGLCFTFTGITLAKCWTIIRENFPEYETDCAAPFIVIGEKAFGTLGKWIVIISLYVTFFGAMVLHLLVGAENFASLFKQVFNKFLLN